MKEAGTAPIAYGQIEFADVENVVETRNAEEEEPGKTRRKNKPRASRKTATQSVYALVSGRKEKNEEGVEVWSFQSGTYEAVLPGDEEHAAATAHKDPGLRLVKIHVMTTQIVLIDPTIED